MGIEPDVTIMPASGVHARHPTIFEPATLILPTVLCVIGGWLGSAGPRPCATGLYQAERCGGVEQDVFAGGVIAAMR